MNATSIAEYIVKYRADNGTPLSNMELQKVLYCAQHFFLKYFDTPLFNEDFEAWKFGAVVPSVYYEYSYLGAYPIHRLIGEEANLAIKMSLGEDAVKILNEVIESTVGLGRWGTRDPLVRAGTAWDTIFKNGKGFKEIIPKHLIKSDSFKAVEAKEVVLEKIREFKCLID